MNFLFFFLHFYWLNAIFNVISYYLIFCYFHRLLLYLINCLRTFAFNCLHFVNTCIKLYHKYSTFCPITKKIEIIQFSSEPTKHHHLRSSFGSRTLFLARRSSSDREVMRPSSSSLPNAFLALLLSMIKSKLNCTVRNSREVYMRTLHILVYVLDRAVGYFFLPRISICVNLLWWTSPLLLLQ